MKVFVTGGTGFVGGEILRQLGAAGHEVRCLVRPGSEKKLATREGIETRPGDAADPATLAGALEGCDAVIHLVGIIREFPGRGITFEKLHAEATRNVVAAAQSQGVRRYLQMSANGSREGAATGYHRTKWLAEKAVRASSLDWTIFRPSLVFGAGGEFVNTLAELVRRLPVVPVFGDGRYRIAPVAVEDVARSFALALDKPETIGQTYLCCGPQDYSYDEVLDAIGAAVGKSRVCKVHQPLLLMKPLVALLEGVPRFPITSDQLTMLLEGNVCDPGPWAETFGLSPVSFAEGVKEILAG